jgi:hypothetical protein
MRRRAAEGMAAPEADTRDLRSASRRSLAQLGDLVEDALPLGLGETDQRRLRTIDGLKSIEHRIPRKARRLDDYREDQRPALLGRVKQLA